jgi:hypothetical protein
MKNLNPKNMIFDPASSDEVIVSLLGVYGREVALPTTVALADDQKLIKIDKAHMSSGIYCIKIKTSGLIFSEKIMAKKSSLVR